VFSLRPHHARVVMLQREHGQPDRRIDQRDVQLLEQALEDRRVVFVGRNKQCVDACVGENDRFFTLQFRSACGGVSAVEQVRHGHRDRRGRPVRQRQQLHLPTQCGLGQVQLLRQRRDNIVAFDRPAHDQRIAPRVGGNQRPHRFGILRTQRRLPLHARVHHFLQRRCHRGRIGVFQRNQLQPVHVDRRLGVQPPNQPRQHRHRLLATGHHQRIQADIGHHRRKPLRRNEAILVRAGIERLNHRLHARRVGVFQRHNLHLLQRSAALAVKILGDQLGQRNGGFTTGDNQQVRPNVRRYVQLMRQRLALGRFGNRLPLDRRSRTPRQGLSLLKHFPQHGHRLNRLGVLHRNHFHRHAGRDRKRVQHLDECRERGEVLGRAGQHECVRSLGRGRIDVDLDRFG